MTQAQIDELEKLIAQYNERFGEEKGHEISGALMFSFDVEAQIKIFKNARGREIILEHDPNVIDGVEIKFKKMT